MRLIPRLLYARELVAVILKNNCYWETTVTRAFVCLLYKEQHNKADTMVGSPYRQVIHNLFTSPVAFLKGEISYEACLE